MRLGGASPIIFTLLVAGCSIGGEVAPEGAVVTDGESTAVAFAGLVTGAAPDVAVMSPSRGTIEILAQNPDDSWRLIGSFFSGGVGAQLVGGRVSGNGLVAVLDTGGSVSLLGADPAQPHRLLFPVQAYRRIRNGKPVDSTPPARGMTLADLDGDCSDELIVGSDLGVAVVRNLDPILKANPEKPPRGDGAAFDAGPKPGVVAALDFDGDGKLDVLALDESEAAVRTLRNLSTPGKISLATADVLPLPSLGVSIHATGCTTAPAVIVLSDGRLAMVSRTGKVTLEAADLTPIKQVASGGAQVALASSATNNLSLFDACTVSDHYLGLASGMPANLALTPLTTNRAHELALLSPDTKTVQLIRLTGF